MPGIILILLCAALWATDALFRLPLSRNLDAATIVLLEHVVCVIATFPWFYARRRELARLKIKGWCAITFVGVMGSAGGTYFFTAAYGYLNPSVVILLQKTQPVFAVVGARLFLGEKPRRNFYFWGLLALLGGALVSLPEHPAAAGLAIPAGRYHGVCLALGAAFCWGLSTVFGKLVTSRVSFPVTSFLRFAWGLVGIAFLFRPSLQIAAGSYPSIIMMGLIPGVLAMYFYYAGLRRTSASAATFAEMFFPVAAVIINWKFLGQSLNTTQMVGMPLLLAAVFFISKGMR